MTRDAFMRELEYLCRMSRTMRKKKLYSITETILTKRGLKRGTGDPGVRQPGARGSHHPLRPCGQSGGGRRVHGERIHGRAFRDPGYQVAHRYDLPESAGGKAAGQTGESGESGKKAEPRTSRLLKIVLVLVLLALALPVAWGIGQGLWGLAGCILALLIVLLVFLGLVTVGFLIAGVIMIPWGIVMAFASPWSGLVVFGSGLALAGLGLLGLALSVLFYGRFVPFVIRGIADCLNRFFHKNRRDEV